MRSGDHRALTGRSPWSEGRPLMFKLIAVLAAAIPVVLFLHTIFFKRSKVLQKAFADFNRQVDYLSWGILFCVGCAIVYSVGKLIFSFWK